MVTVSYSELAEAFDFANFGGGAEQAAYLSLDAGRFYCVSDLLELEEEVPGDLETSDRYLLLPAKRDLGLGRELALRFLEESYPALVPEVRQIFHHKGAYARYKGLLESHHALEAWYRFEADATKEALLQWCRENGIQVADA